MTIGIYCIINPSNKIYIGSSTNIERRFKQYKSLFCKRQKAIYASLIKYGVDAHIFQIHLECTKEDLLYFEQLYIDRLKPELNIAKIAGNPPYKSGEKHHNWKGGVSLDLKTYAKSEKYKIKQKSYQQSEKYKTYKKEYGKVNKDRLKEYKKQYYEQNKEKILEQNKEYRKVNKEKNKTRTIYICQ